MKVVRKEGKDILTDKLEFNGAKVLHKLILKAEKRKSYAENFHIYAVLQSTIRRLKLDNKSLKVTKVSRSYKVGNSEDDGLKNIKLSSVENSVVNIHNIYDDKDPLKLDLFFEELNNL